MRQHLPRHALQLGRGDVHPLSRRFQCVQAFPHAGIRLVFEPARLAVICTEAVDGRLDIRLREIDGKRLDQRRADKLPQRLFGQTGDSERVQRGLRCVHDSWPGVRQRSVQIK